MAYRLATLKRLLLHFASWDYQLIEEELVLPVLVDLLHVVIGAAPHLGGLAIGPVDYPMIHLFQFSVFLLGTIVRSVMSWYSPNSL